MKLSTEQWAALSKFLETGMDLPPGEQQAWVDGLTGLDPALKPALLQMLASGEDFGEDGAGSDFLQTLPKFSPGAASPTNLVSDGRLIGSYRPIRELGRGGMGSVWLAERADGEMTRQVAIKLPHAIQSTQFLDRFRRERDILATLTHPNIAQIYDAGATADGRPYLVMEFVDGVPIDIFCKDIGIRERLELFLPVCEAVSYAHEHLVIHRDLKPSNILVDRSGKPKLLDFGIAKLLDDTEATSTVERLMTPGYASPEQIQGGVQTTKTDVYSLGAVLYNLLTGRSPHVSASGTSQAIDIAIGKSTIVEASKANPDLPRDLDYILAKALRREPKERYGSPKALADDIRAFLSSKPVAARAGDTWYRARKVLRLYWAPVAAAAAVIASLSAGLYVANRERTIAQQRFSEVRQLAHTFVFDVYDDVAKLQGSTKTREMMVRTGLQYLARLGESAGNDLGLQKEIAAAYVKIGEAQGSPTLPSLGHTTDALESFRKALEIYQRIAAKDPIYLRDLGDQYVAYSSMLRLTGNLKQAEEFSKSGIATLERLPVGGPLDKQNQGKLIKAWCTQGDLHEKLSKYRLAFNDYAHCSELARALAARYPEPFWLYMACQAAERRTTATQAFGDLSGAMGALTEDESFLTQALAKEPLNPTFRRAQALLYQFRSILYFDDQRPNYEDAAKGLENAKLYLKATEDMVRGDPNDRSAQRSRAIAGYRVSLTLSQFDPPAAVKIASESVNMFDQFIASGRNDDVTRGYRATALKRLAGAQISAKRFAEAQSTAEEALAIERGFAAQSGSGSHDDTDLVLALVVAGRAYASAGKWEQAEALLQEACEKAKGIVNPEELTSFLPSATAERELGGLYQARQRIPEARASYQRLVALWQKYGESNEYLTRQRAQAEKLLAGLK